MVAMAAMVVRQIELPVTVKTRIGFDKGHDPRGTGMDMPIVDLARRLEDVGVRALTIHCRTASMGHSGAADWSWAARAREVTSIPVIVNGDVDSAEAAARALAETACAGVMIGRRAIDHPWVFREARALLDRGETIPPPSVGERLAMSRRLLSERYEQRGAVSSARRHLGGFMKGLPGAASLRRELFLCDSLEGCLAILDRYEANPASAGTGSACAA
jgi:tRNA-dihydrouridine synthase